MAKMWAMTTAKKLMKLCDMRKWDHNQLADVVPGVSESTVYNWIHGRSKPNLIMSLLIAREFKVPLEWLADDKAPWPAPGPEFADDEVVLARHYRVLKRTRGIDLEEAMARLDGGQGTIGVGGVSPVLADQATEEEQAETEAKVPDAKSKKRRKDRG